MEPRTALALAIAAVVALFLLGAILYASREWRAERRGYKRFEQRREERKRELRDAPGT
jgi:predicted transporter